MLQKVNQTVTHEEMIRRAHVLGELAESKLAEADANCGYDKEFRDALHATGIHRIMRPKRYGGYGMGHRTLQDFVRTVSQYSIAGGWLSLFMPAHECWVSTLMPKGREEIFASDEFVADILYPIALLSKIEYDVGSSGGVGCR